MRSRVHALGAHRAELVGNHRKILALAVPALGALFAEPLFLAADSAIVGRLGTAELAGLSVASAVLLNAVMLCVFLTYGTTSLVAWSAGAGDLRGALRLGMDGIWLAVAVGVILAVVGWPLTSVLVALFGTSPSATPHAEAYLQISVLGLPSMLVVLAATGVMRGLQNTRIPLLVLTVAAMVNVVLNLILVYPAGLGVAGSALGTVLAQTGAALWLGGLVLRRARQHATPLRPSPSGIAAAAGAGVPLIARTVLLRVVVLAMTFVAAAHGDTALASHQIAFTLWFLLAMPPEAFAIAGQAMVGHAIGASDAAAARAVARRVMAWGLGSGLALALLVIALRPVYIPLYTTDSAVRDLVFTLALVLAATQPIGAVLYVLDAVLIGAGDTRYLAWVMLIALMVFLPLAWLILATRAGVIVLWWALGAWLLARLVTVYLRYRSNAWLLSGPSQLTPSPGPRHREG
jgi:putative MATE family efflux protein